MTKNHEDLGIFDYVGDKRVNGDNRKFINLNDNEEMKQINDDDEISEDNNNINLVK